MIKTKIYFVKTTNEMITSVVIDGDHSHLHNKKIHPDKVGILLKGLKPDYSKVITDIEQNFLKFNKPHSHYVGYYGADYGFSRATDKVAVVTVTHSPKDKTLLIYREIGGDEQMKYAILEGDYSRWDGITINGDTHPYQKEFSDFMWDEETGKELPNFISKNEAFKSNYDHVIVCSFIC